MTRLLFNRKAIIYPLAGLVIMLSGCAAGQAVGIESLVPTEQSLDGLTPLDSPEVYGGEDLFKLINGGAEVFIAAGFEKVAAQQFQTADGYLYSLEIYRMKSADSARQIYLQQGGADGSGGEIAEAEKVGEYYGMFRRGNYYFTVTAFERNDQARDVISRIAAAVIERMK